MFFDNEALWGPGPVPGAFFNFPGKGSAPRDDQKLKAHTLAPITTTTTVLAVKFDDGCVVAADTLGSYGTVARYRDCRRIWKVNDNILLGCGGDYADFQYLRDIIRQKIIDEQCIGDGLQLKPRSLHCWLTRVLYSKRSKMDPLWSDYIVAGIQDDEPFLAAVDKLGTAYEAATIATGLGAFLAAPLLRSATEHGPICEEAAKKLVKKCMEVLYCRDARAFRRYQVGVVTAAGIQVSDPIEVKTNSTLAKLVEMK